ncbi:DMT family transporter [Nesterenkonia sp. HG001]|uniref:DMT family transporter n=1 Tax=Nesterenkonia sp. HG001 TaxID=2983207 RepID=UPI002AC4F14E|nr:DMT family transporter [Nesterenkonia sp. HG001]MDZ5077651.1 DMT family transporter [Nesterenkonia sp. HG001]
MTRLLAADALAHPAAAPPAGLGPGGIHLDGTSGTPGRWSRLAAPAAVAVTVTLWASSFVIIRWAAPVFSPGPLALIRLVAGVAMLTLMLLVLRRRMPRLPRLRVLAMIVVYGALWFAAYTVILNHAGHHLDAGTTAMVVNVSPILVAVSAGLLFREGWPRSLFAGMAVALAGIALITLAAGDGQISLVGVVLALVAAVTYSIAMLLQRAVLPGMDPLTVVWLGCAAGTLAVLPWAGQAWAELQAAPAAAIWGAVSMGVGATALGFSLWAFAQTRMPTGRLAACSLAVPAVAVAMSALTLGEVPTPLAIVGGALCLVGVGVAQLGRR